MTEQVKLNWTRLFQDFGAAEKFREELARRRKEEEAALREFEVWSSNAIERLMHDLKVELEKRSAELLRATGQQLTVEYPSGTPIRIPERGPEIRFLHIAMAEAQVHIYSSRARAGVTHVHLLPSRFTSLRDNHRLISEPGAFIVRLPDDGYELRYMRGDPDGAMGSRMSLDTLVFRAFRLLLSSMTEQAGALTVVKDKA